MKKKLWSSLALFLAATASSAAWALPNPAAVLCGKLGGTLESLNSESGEVGSCRFGRGIIDSWTLFRSVNGVPQQAVTALLSHGGGSGSGGGINPASVYCGRLGATEVSFQSRSGGAVGFCTFQDGSSIESWTLFRGAYDPSNQRLIQALRRRG